jgi:hypothetical protein
VGPKIKDLKQYLKRFGLYQSLFTLLTILSMGMGSFDSHAGMFEVSLGFSYNRTNYSTPENYNTSNRWTTSLGYFFSESSEIELNFSDSREKTVLVDYQQSEFHDRVYSVSWVQSIFPRSYRIQPYARAGIGQLNRDGTVDYYSSGEKISTSMTQDSLTGVLGVGLKFPIINQLGFKSEAMTYLKGAAINTWKDNISVTLGFSFYF